jgi:hypothetical protein
MKQMVVVRKFAGDQLPGPRFNDQTIVTAGDLVSGMGTDPSTDTQQKGCCSYRLK